MAATDDTALTMKEAIMEVRIDVKNLLNSLPLKADRVEFNLLVVRVERLESEAARAAELKQVESKVQELTEKQAAITAVAQFKKVIVGTAVTAILALVGLIGSVVIHFLPSNSAHH